MEVVVWKERGFTYWKAVIIWVPGTCCQDFLLLPQIKDSEE